MPRGRGRGGHERVGPPRCFASSSEGSQAVASCLGIAPAPWRVQTSVWGDLLLVEADLLGGVLRSSCSTLQPVTGAQALAMMSDKTLRPSMKRLVVSDLNLER